MDRALTAAYECRDRAGYGLSAYLTEARANANKSNVAETAPEEKKGILCKVGVPAVGPKKKTSRSKYVYPTKRHAREVRRLRRASAATSNELHCASATSLHKREAKHARKAATEACEGCGTKFGIFCWKHSCSVCCQVMCDECTPQRGSVDARVCDGCHVPRSPEQWKRKLLDGQGLMSCPARWKFALNG